MASEIYHQRSVNLADKQDAIVNNWWDENRSAYPSNGFSAALRFIIDDWAELRDRQPPTAEPEAEGLAGLA